MADRDDIAEVEASWHRSAVTNGTALHLERVDGRSKVARRFRDVFLALKADGGGDLTEARTILARRAATLATWCELQEAKLANGEDLDVERFNSACNTLRRLLSDLGLDRRAREITPTLAAHLEAVDL